MTQSFNKDKLLKDYYQCIQFQKLRKTNSEAYVKMRLINKNGVFDGYIWDMVDFYNNRIKEGDIYAIKAREELYNDRIILNIKHLNRVDGGRYDKYNYNSNNIKLSKKKLVEYYYDELIDLISIHEDPIINAILDFYIKNKKKLLNLNLLRHKTMCIKHLNILHKNYDRKIDFNLCVIIILIDRVQADLLISKIKKIDLKYYKIIQFYILNHKEFIKKYKYIVDLISYNLSNEKIFKTN